MNDKKPDVTLFFPVYCDENTVARVTEKALRVLSEVAVRYEAVIIDDGSPDRSEKIADELADRHDCVRVIHHPRNMGYGAAIQTGFANSKFNGYASLTGTTSMTCLT